MSLIHTCELNDANPFDYLTELQKHAKELVKHPSAWMPWNYPQTLPQASTSEDPAAYVRRHVGIGKWFHISWQLQIERVNILGTGVFNQHRRIIWRQPYPRTHEQIPRLANVRQA